jgi:acetyl esterase/lipase
MRFAALLFSLLIFAARASAQDSFYDTSPADIAGPPGTIIRSEPMPGSRTDATTLRILYRSLGTDGQLIAVSGVLIVPNGAQDAKRPIVAWAHPTSGVIPRCAPSLAGFFYEQVQGLRTMIREGYVVVATDYSGLGTPQLHPYLIGVSEGRAVLDSVRAAQTLAGASNRFIVWGHSQGGQAALYTGLLAKTYAPDLQLMGVAAAAPATDLATLFSDDIDTTGGRGLTAMTLWSWSQLFNTSLKKVVAPSAILAVTALAHECIESPIDIWARHRSEKPLETAFLSVTDITQIEPWHSIMVNNTPGTLDPSIPVFLAQGAKDQVVRPAVTQAYRGALCHAGSNVQFYWMPNAGHGVAAMKSALAAIAWMGDRFAGTPAPSNCGA